MGKVLGTLLALAFGALSELGFEVWTWKGAFLINASLVCLELLPNFQGENQAAFHLTFVVEIRQRFISGAS